MRRPGGAFPTPCKRAPRIIGLPLTRLAIISIAAVCSMQVGCTPPASEAVGEVSLLAGGPLPADVAGRVDRDVDQLRAIAGGLADRQQHDGAFVASLLETTRDRTYYEPEEERQLRRRFRLWLEYRRSLLMLAQRYADWASAETIDLRRRCLLIAAAATITVNELDATVADVFVDRMVQRKCNETRGDVPLPADALDLILLAAADEANGEVCREYLVRVEAIEADRPSTDPRDRWLIGRIRNAWAGRERRAATVEAVARDVRLSRANEGAAEGAIQSQWALSQVIAAAVVPRDRCITLQNVRDAQRRLQPGDLLFRHRYGRLSNYVIPGFWTHSAIYLGTEADLRGLGLAVPSEIVDRLRSGLPEDAYVIESINEGVVVSTLQVNMDCDDVVAFRPRLNDEQRVTFLQRTFDYFGCEYDFDFDIATADKLTCIELIWRCAGEMIPLETRQTAGREMFLPNDIVQDFVAESGLPGRRADFVMLLISDSPRTPARFGSEAEVP